MDEYKEQQEEISKPILEPTAQVEEAEELHYPVLKDFHTGEKGFKKDDILSSRETNDYQLRWLRIDGYVGNDAI